MPKSHAERQKEYSSKLSLAKSETLRQKDRDLQKSKRLKFKEEQTKLFRAKEAARKKVFNIHINNAHIHLSRKKSIKMYIYFLLLFRQLEIELNMLMKK